MLTPSRALVIDILSFSLFISPVMQPSPINNIKRAQIYKKRVIHALIMNNIDK